MAMEFDPMKMAEDAARAVAGAAGDAAHAASDVVCGISHVAADIAGGIVGAASQAVDAAGKAVNDVVAPKEPVYRYAGVVRDDRLLVPKKSILVRVMGIDAKGQLLEGRPQLLSLSSKGCRLRATESALSPVTEVIPVGNCLLFEGGRKSGVNPVVEAGITGWGLGQALGPAGLVVGAVLGAKGALFGRKPWYVEIQTIENEKYTLKLQSREDGDTLMAFLDAYMLR